MAEVIVVGAGPAGMMLAAELALGGVEVCVLERRASDELLATRAGGFHSRTVEILDQRGIADRFLDAGQTAQTARFGNSTLDISDFPTRHPYGLALWQNRIEPILAGWIDELGVRVERGREVAGFTQDAGGVEVVLSDGERVQATYVVGADGGRSTIRTAAGIEFAGWDATRSNLIAEVEVTQQPPRGVRMDERGAHGLQPLDDGRTYRVVTAESQLTRSAHPTLTDLSAALERVFGTDFGVHSRARSRGSPTPPVRPRRIGTVARCSSGMPRTSTTRPAGRASGSASRMRSTWAGSWPRWSRGSPRRRCSIPITMSAIPPTHVR